MTHTGTYREDELEQAPCEECGNVNLLNGEKAGCFRCKNLLCNAARATGDPSWSDGIALHLTVGDVYYFSGTLQCVAREMPYLASHVEAEIEAILFDIIYLRTNEGDLGDLGLYFHGRDFLAMAASPGQAATLHIGPRS